jgi:hypothetical protein
MSSKCKNGSGCVGIVGLAHTINSYFVTHMQVLQVKVWNFILSHRDSPWSSWSKVIAIITHQKIFKKQKRVMWQQKNEQKMYKEMEGDEEGEDRGGNKRRRGRKNQEIIFTCFIHLDLQGAFLLSLTNFDKPPPPQA